MAIKSFTLRHNIVKLEKRNNKYVVIRSNPMNEIENKFKTKKAALKYYNRSVRKLKNTIKRIDMMNRAWVR